jgi:hypothetical protein
MDEILRNLAPPLGVMAAAIVAHLWARGVHRRGRARRPAHPAE